MKKYLFISVKEQYTNRILDGTKRIELRKSRPSVSAGDYVIIYCTSPVKAIVGVAQVDELICHTPQQMWKLHSKKLGIDRKDYFDYYVDSDKAIGIVLSQVKKLSYGICLNIIKQHLPRFTPPQTYKYFLNFTFSECNQDFKLTPFP
jgi:predicted transcriptional regulator